MAERLTRRDPADPHPDELVEVQSLPTKSITGSLNRVQLHVRCSALPFYVCFVRSCAQQVLNRLLRRWRETSGECVVTGPTLDPIVSIISSLIAIICIIYDRCVVYSIV
jgi:hypothetical protein